DSFACTSSPAYRMLSLAGASIQYLRSCSTDTSPRRSTRMRLVWPTEFEIQALDLACTIHEPVVARGGDTVTNSLGPTSRWLSRVTAGRNNFSRDLFGPTGPAATAG